MATEETAISNHDVLADRVRMKRNSNADGDVGRRVKAKPFQYDMLLALDVNQNRRVRPADCDRCLAGIGAAEEMDVQVLILVEEALRT